MQSYPDPNAGAGAGGAPFSYSTSGQQQSGVPNPDELQMNAQLARLEPVMNASPGGNMASESQDPRGSSQGNVNHQYEHGLPHAGQMQSLHGPMDQMGAYDGSPDGSMAPRKRSKVSRACDECRRKKIRCDATGESDNEQCSNCKRVGTNCQFSRVPMKRGPSKGYIKELADRLNTLESAVHAGEVPMNFLHQESPTQRRPSEEYSPPPNPETRKRGHSAVSNDYTPSRPANWNSPETRHVPHPPPATYQPQAGFFKDSDYASNGLQQPSSWKMAPEQHLQDASTFVVTQDVNSEYAHGWDESIIDGYYQHIHPTFKILQNDKSKLRVRLDVCPGSLKAAFYEAIQVAVRSLPASSQRPAELPRVRRAAQLLHSARLENFPPSLSTDLICLQAMILLAIATADSPAIILRPQPTSPKSSLADAIEVAYAMRLHQYKPQALGEDHDSDDKIARRLWYTLVSLDRWYAASTGRPALIPDSIVIVWPEDQFMLGESFYHIARKFSLPEVDFGNLNTLGMSLVLEHTSRVLSPRPDLPPMNFNPPVYGSILRGELERLRESFSGSLFPPTQAPVLHICFWHMRILIELTLEESTPTAMADAVLNLVTQLNRHVGVFSPLIHYCLALAALTLIELLEYEETRNDAELALKSLLNTRVAYSSWDTPVREMITNRLQRPSSASLGMSSSAAESSKHAAVASQSLQRLADLATATGGREVGGGEDRNEGEKGTIPAAASTPASARNLYPYYSNLRRVVGDGILNAFMIGGESAR
ncbi:uncharacterized protein LY89DRAFT_166528 [Mollisia scopiformis]|uniref:Zn(2)-C6 fungal-type domain-containing protein n=1 Tax=Mollisia scopiformis TaxID=149040 RepID=A0A194XTP7_MOLSC|nr:uncharacterized protein LY89DRAFT_166528 [Mollisia scopiformis]KUJ23072.1 hypothetical protein LY89DRAFT_166528 [Mollisia scopiformis]